MPDEQAEPLLLDDQVPVSFEVLVEILDCFAQMNRWPSEIVLEQLAAAAGISFDEIVANYLQLSGT